MTKHLSIQQLLAALLTIAAIATGQTVWADDVTLSEDNDFGINEAGHWYVNMPTDGKDYLTLNVQDLQNGKNVFKVYDDGGKNGNYTSGCDSKIVINVPDGYLIQISGTVWTYYNTSAELLKVFDGEREEGYTWAPSNLLARVYSPTDGEAKDFGPLNTTRKAMYLYFRTKQFQTTTFQGLDLTVTVYQKVSYSISVAQGIEHGSVSPSANSAYFNDVITLTVTPDTAYYIGTVTWSDTIDHVITPTSSGVYSFNMPQHDVTVSATFLDTIGYNWGEGNDGSVEHPYVIRNRAGWDYLVYMSKHPDNTRGKHFRLDTDLVNVTQPLSFFCGHLDGNHHTISINMTYEGCGLIDNVSYYGCTISNLTVEGSIENPAAIVGGFIARSAMIDNTITLTDCRSNVTITSNYTGSSSEHYYGGFVGKAINVACVGCVFDGAFISSTTFGFGGLVGWCSQLSVTDCAVVFGSATNLTNEGGGNFSFAHCNHITQQGHNFYFNKGYIFHIIPNDITPVYPLTLTNPAAAVRTGGIAIGNGAGTVYADGFTLNGDEYYQQSASVIFGAPALLVTAAQYNDGTVHNATINNGTATFTMPAKAVTATITSFAANYIDADGTEQTCDPVTLLSSSTETVSEPGGWYAVIGEVTIRKGLIFSDSAHLILTDGATLNVSTPNQLQQSQIIAINATDLSVYGQTLGTGTLNAISKNMESNSTVTRYAYAIYATGNVTFCGGQVNAEAMILKGSSESLPGYGYGIYAEGSVNIIRGNISAMAELEYNRVNAYLFNITAGGVLLDWRCPTDRICLTVATKDAPRLSPVSVAEGKALWNGTEVLSGTIWIGGGDTHALGKFNGKTLQPCIAREVAGYDTDNGGWVFISSPVTGNIAPTTVGGLMASTATEYDLYRFNQSAALEWENYKAHSSDFNLVNGQGYLYATKGTKTLAFMGEAFNMGTEDVEVPLVYDEGKPLAGWNLVGNPFAVEAYVNRPFYKMNDDGTGIEAIENYDNYTTADAIPACTGIVVKAESDNESVTFSTTAPSLAAPNNGSLQIALSQADTRGNALLDNAILSFNEGSKLGKFYFGEQNANIYLPQGSEEYAIVSVGNMGEIPLNFKANENGTYTITVNVDNVEMAYLHLIDNMTGADVDLLSTQNVIAGEDPQSPTPSYTFTAKTTDYESRFKLVFSADEAVCEPNEAFAFISNGNIIVNGEGTLQIFDILGHQLVTKQLSTLNSQLSTLNYKSGVYVLRLINGENVRTQKIVIE